MPGPYGIYNQSESPYPKIGMTIHERTAQDFQGHQPATGKTPDPQFF